MLLLGVVLAALTVALWLPNLVDLMALTWAAARRRRGDGARDGARHGDRHGAVETPRLLFLVPAHNESLLIEQCVRSLVNMDYPANSRRIVVIADNCTDDTALLARRAGAESLERFDTEQRGKPRALAWAIDQLDITRFAACVVVDADTSVAAGFARGFADIAPLDRIAAQAYIGTMNEYDNWLTRLAGVLARCRYDVTYRLRDAAGLHCPLTGNGMCIGRALLERGWQAFSLTENWELYARYTAEGVPIRFAPNARLFTQQVRTMRQGHTQRSRWLAGRTSVLKEWALPIARSRAATAVDRFATLAELAALSPVLHLSLACVVALLALLLPAGWRAAISLGALGSLASQLVATCLVLARHPHRLATMRAFARLPIYAGWRASVAITTLLLPGTGEWRKTDRHSI